MQSSATKDVILGAIVLILAAYIATLLGLGPVVLFLGIVVGFGVILGIVMMNLFRIGAPPDALQGR